MENQQEQEFKVPKSKKRNFQQLVKGEENILEEDEYLERMEKIIKRDFFPDIIKLNQYEKKINHLLTSQDNDKIDDLSLNQFIRQYKSEDNETIKDLLEQDRKTWLKNHWWVYLQQENQDKQLALEGDKQNENKLFLENNQEKRLLLASSENEVQPFFFPPTKIHNLEIGDLVPKKKQIFYENTRFEEGLAIFNNLSATQSKEQNLNTYIQDDTNQNLQTPNLIGQQIIKEKYVLTDLIARNNKNLQSILKPDAKTINGHKLIDLPDPSPGQMNTPIVTWGEIEGTPERLDQQKQMYRIPQTAPREKVAEDLVLRFHKTKEQIKKKSDKNQSALLSNQILNSSPNIKKLAKAVSFRSKLVQDLIKQKSEKQSFRSFTPFDQGDKSIRSVSSFSSALKFNLTHDNKNISKQIIPQSKK